METNIEKVLCGSNSYDRKYYLNNEFDNLPTSIKEELQILCVTFTEDIGGILTLGYDDEGNMKFEVIYDEGDLLFDEIGCGLKIKQIQQDKKDLLEALETYYKVFALEED